MVHYLKILNDYAEAVLLEDKKFEIRENDRGFQKGDYVRFQTVGKDGLPIRHAINDKRYRITYVLGGWGLKDGYVAFAIEKQTEIRGYNNKTSCRDESTTERLFGINK